MRFSGEVRTDGGDDSNSRVEMSILPNASDETRCSMMWDERGSEWSRIDAAAAGI